MRLYSLVKKVEEEKVQLKLHHQEYNFLIHRIEDLPVKLTN